MTALSRQLANPGQSELPSRAPRAPTQESTLTRKVKSELNLLDLRCGNSSRIVSGTIMSEASSTAPDKVNSEADLFVKDVIECNAFVALKELGALVARRKGLEVSSFVTGLMSLIVSEHVVTKVIEPGVGEDNTHSPVVRKDANAPAGELTPRPLTRKIGSQSQQKSDRKSRRHFSFEPGDDQVREVKVGFQFYDSLSQTDSTEFEPSSSVEFRVFAEGLQPDGDDSVPPSSSLGAENPKPSMIPSPVQTVGRVRRENSMSSLQSVFVKNIQDDRHNSRTSIQTAFRETPSANASMESKSRSSSNHNLSMAESPLGSKERLDSLTSRPSAAALAAARAAEAGNSLLRSNTRMPAAASSSRNRLTAGQQTPENCGPGTYNNAGKRDAE